MSLTSGLLPSFTGHSPLLQSARRKINTVWRKHMRSGLCTADTGIIAFELRQKGKQTDLSDTGTGLGKFSLLTKSVLLVWGTYGTSLWNGVCEMKIKYRQASSPSFVTAHSVIEQCRCEAAVRAGRLPYSVTGEWAFSSPPLLDSKCPAVAPCIDFVSHSFSVWSVLSIELG